MHLDSYHDPEISGKGLTGPLRIITICTNDLEDTLLFYRDRLGMTATGPIVSTEEQVLRLKQYLDIDPEIDISCYHIYEQDTEGISIRLIYLSQEVPAIKTSRSALHLGPLGLVCTLAQSEDISSVMKAPDFNQVMISGEDELHKLGIRQSCLITDQMDKEHDFLTRVLSMSILSDKIMSAGKASPVGLEPNVKYRISQLSYAEGEKSFLELIEPQDVALQEPDVPLRPPYRGQVMWTFMTRDIGEVLARSHARQIKVYKTPRKITDPIYGDAISMILMSPTGYLIEVYARL